MPDAKKTQADKLHCNDPDPFQDGSEVSPMGIDLRLLNLGKVHDLIDGLLWTQCTIKHLQGRYIHR